MERALNVNEIAEIIGVNSRTVRREIDRGKLPHFRAGKSVRVRFDALMKYIRADEDPGLRHPRKPLCRTRRPKAEAE